MRLIFLLLAIVLTSCTRPVASGGADLAGELAGYAAGAPQSCVMNLPSHGLRVIDSSTLALGSRGTIYVNHLGGPCPAISSFNTLIVDAQNGRYCRGDRVHGLEPGALIPGPVCILGDWVPYHRR
jgi:hypothetical protein